MRSERPAECPSGKRWFLHESDAQSRCLADEVKFGWKMKAYLCPECGWWHKARRKKDGLPILILDWIQKKRRSGA